MHVEPLVMESVEGVRLSVRVCLRVRVREGVCIVGKMYVYIRTFMNYVYTQLS